MFRCWFLIHPLFSHCPKTLICKIQFLHISWEWLLLDLSGEEHLYLTSKEARKDSPAAWAPAGMKQIFTFWVYLTQAMQNTKCTKVSPAWAGEGLTMHVCERVEFALVLEDNLIT